MEYLKQSTAIEVKLGPFLDDADGKTPETALTITQADVRLAKGPGDWAQKNESTSLVHEENGWYRCLLDATDTATLGTLKLAINESGALPVWETYTVLEANVYESLISIGGVPSVNLAFWLGVVPAALTGAGEVLSDMQALGGSNQSAIDLKDFADAGYDPAVNKIEGVKLADVLTTYTGNTPQSGDVFPLVSTEVADIKAKTDQLVFTTANRVDSTVVDKTGFSLSVAGIAAIWDALLTGITTVGSIGKLLKDNIDAAISSRLATAGYTAPDNTSIAAILVDTAEMQPKLPTNNIMGSAVKTDKDDEIDAIKVQTDKFVFTNAGKVDAAVLAAGDFAQAAADKVWLSAARTLTSFGTLVADVATSVWASVSRTLTGGVTVTTNNDKTGYALSSAGVDAIHDDEVETGITFREAARVGVAADSGKTNGALGPTFNIRNAADTKDRVSATVDADGNRTAITRDLT